MADRMRLTSLIGDPDEADNKKPTWWNARRHSTTSAYSSTSLPASPSCPSSSHPTTFNLLFYAAERAKARQLEFRLNRRKEGDRNRRSPRSPAGVMLRPAERPGPFARAPPWEPLRRQLAQ